MANDRLWLSMACGALLAAGPVLFAQTVSPVPQSTGESVRAVPPVRNPLAASPFAVESASRAQVRILPRTEVTPADKDVLARVEPTLQRRARNMDLGFGAGTWSYVQLACPSFPGHLLLRFTRDGGKGDVSMFSVSIPRGNAESLRVIPILRRSYMLFSPVAANPVAVATFNRMLDEEKFAKKPDWVNLAQCYAALAGADPLPQSAGMAPSLDLTADRRVVIHFVTAQPRPRQWAMVFDRSGRLIEARSTLHATDVVKERRIPADGTLSVQQVPATANYPQHAVP